MKTFAVSKRRLDAGRRIPAGLWGQVDLGKNDRAATEVVVPVACLGG